MRLGLLFVILCSVAFCDPVGYTFTDLGEGVATAINGSGTIVGYSNGVAFAYAGGVRTSLGTLFDGSNSAALGINDAGQIVGSANDSAGGTSFMYSNGSMQDLHVSGIKGINDFGVMVGTTSTGTGTTSEFGFTYDGSVNPLPLLPGSTGYSIGSAINNNGQVTGTASSGLGNFAFVAQGGNITSLGAFGAGAESHGFAINDSGHVTGMATDAYGTNHAFLYTGGPLIDLGTLSGSTRSRGLGINDSDTVVGYADSQFDNTYGNRAFVSFGGQMTDLNSFLPAGSGWSQLWQATDINDSGDIVGWGLTTRGTFDAFLATPVSSVPEPSSTLAMSLVAYIVIAGAFHDFASRRVRWASPGSRPPLAPRT